MTNMMEVDPMLSEESESDNCDDLLQRCLPVSGAPMPPSETPAASADEYLRQVAWEAMRCPQTVTAEDVVEQPTNKRGPRYAARLRELEPTASAFEATDHWKADVAEYVRVLRSRVEQEKVPKARWSQTKGNWLAGKLPDSAQLCGMDCISSSAAIVDLIQSLNEDMSDDKLILTCRWIFGVMLRVDIPLTPDLQHELQVLRRFCEAKRSQESLRPTMNLLHTVCTEVFHQR